jgi:hypothetical protein
MTFAEHQRGPVILRRGQVRPGTTDQRLLDSRGPSDWVHTDPWRVLRIQSEFVEGFGLLADLPQAVSVFGSARTPAHHPDYDAARRLGASLARAGFAVITGGGPGSMEAVNRELLTVTDDADEVVTHIVDSARQRERAVDALVHDAQ